MATEAIKLILGKGEPLVGRLMLYDSLRMSFRDVRIRKDPQCELCGEHPSITELIDYQTFCAVELPAAAKAETAAEVDPRAVEVSAGELKELIESGKRITLLDVREPHEWEINRIEPARLTPLSQFEQFISELNPDDDIYLLLQGQALPHRPQAAQGARVQAPAQPRRRHRPLGGGGGPQDGALLSAAVLLRRVGPGRRARAGSGLSLSSASTWAGGTPAPLG